MKIKVQNGDITKIKSDAIITAINSGGAWFGGIDNAIRRSRGAIFHDQARRMMPLKDGDTIIAKDLSSTSFSNVVFVVDDLEQPLQNVIYTGLKAAMNAGFKTITLPTIRMGVMLGVVEKSMSEAVDEMVTGVSRHIKQFGNVFDEITFVTYNEPAINKLLEKQLNKIWKYFSKCKKIGIKQSMPIYFYFQKLLKKTVV